MKSVLITGGAGYLGCVAAKKILDNGHNVRVLDPLIFGRHQLAGLVSHPNFDLQVGLTEDRYMLEKCLEGIDCVIHLSGLSNDPSCEIDAELTKRTNVGSTKVLLELCRKQGVERLLYASSCSVYGFTEGRTVDEQSPLNPLTAYAKSKVDCEKLILEEADEALATVCLRKATLFGASPRMRFDLVVNTMTGMAISENKVVINGGEQWRPFLHVEDAADAYLFMLTADKEKIDGQVFNVGGNEDNYRVTDIAERIKSLFSTVEVCQSHSADNRSYRVSFDKINAIGWSARSTIEDGILGIKAMFDRGDIKDFRDLNYFNIKRMISYLNV